MQANSKEIAVVAIFMQGKGSVLNQQGPNKFPFFAS